MPRRRLAPCGPPARSAEQAARERLGVEPLPVVEPLADPDHDLMVAVEQATRRDVPQALAPAALLTQEISRNAKPTGPGRQSKGESR